MKKKVCVVLDTLHPWGIELAALHFQEGMDPELFEYTYLIRLKDGGPMEGRIRQTGARILFQPEETRSAKESLRYMTKLFKDEGFAIVHAHSTFFNGITLLAAERAGVPKRISHAHMTYEKMSLSFKNMPVMMKRAVMRRVILYSATDLLACGQRAGEDQYGTGIFSARGMILDNPVDCRAYAYDPDLRRVMRSRMGIGENELLVGHVGRFNPIKNQPFLITMFAKWLGIRPDMKLLLVGDGGYIGQSLALVKKLGLQKKVLFTGNVTNVAPYLMAMDAFVFPSLKESFPISLVEAQAACLPCVISDGVPQEVKMNENVVFASLSDLPEIWLERLDKVTAYARDQVDPAVVRKRFDIPEISAKLAEIYGV